MDWGVCSHAGGPETIVARSETPDVTVANPFLFKYVPMADDEHDSTYHSTAVKLSPAPASQVRGLAADTFPCSWLQPCVCVHVCTSRSPVRHTVLH